MADIPLTSIKAGYVLPRLAPQLDYPESRSALSSVTYMQVLGIDASAGYAVALSLSGKGAVSYLSFFLVAGDIAIRLTVDGEIKWDSALFTAGGATQTLLGQNTVPDIAAMCSESFLLEVYTPSDSSITLNYLARPIL